MILTPLPYYKYNINSPLSKSDAENRLNSEVSETKTLFIWHQPNNELFYGFISDGKFKINRFGTIRNSFKPVILGNIIQNENGSTIELKFRPHLFVLLFMSIWFAFVLFAATFSIREIVLNEHYDPLIMIPFVMLVFAYIMMMVGFISEINYSMKIFNELFFVDGLYHRMKA